MLSHCLRETSAMMKRLKLVHFLLHFLVYQMSTSSVGGSEAMKRLYEDLFTDYNRLILPIAPNKTKVLVTVGLKLGQILDLNLKQQILSTNVWLNQTWYDHRLEWDPSAYGGIDMVHVPAENIWIPDIVLFNNADGNYELTLIAKAVLYSTGMVHWNPPTMFRSTCEIDVEYFPFDIQTCFLRFGSWTYAGDEVDIKHVGNSRKVDIGIDLSQFYKNVEWDIIDVPAYYNEVYYENRTEPFQDITFKIVIRRKMLFYLVNLILPVALMTFMTVSVFYLPADSNEKVTLSISILTSLIVFFLLMLEVIPPTSLAVPLFGKYLLFTLVLVSLSACVSVYVLNIYHREPSVHQMSPRMRQLFLKTLPRLLRLDRPDPRERSSLNRFRKKKLAQQILQARQNKVYDLAQPVAASLNLIETLQKSYDYNPNEDTKSSKRSKGQTNLDEGRYFRRYVDNYIGKLQAEAAASKGKHNGQQLKHQSSSSSSARTGAMTSRCRSGRAKCCPAANKPLKQQANIHAQNTRPTTSQSCCATTGSLLGHHSTFEPQQKVSGFGLSHVINDDTFDMTFDYDDQEDPQPVGAAESELPSPPPPPRQLAQLSDSMKDLSGRLSSSSAQKKGAELLRAGQTGLDDHEDDGHLVDKLISSINMINNVSDEFDSLTTTSLSNNGDEYQHFKNLAQALNSGPTLPLAQSRIYPVDVNQKRVLTGNEQQRIGQQDCTCPKPMIDNHNQINSQSNCSHSVQCAADCQAQRVCSGLDQDDDLASVQRRQFLNGKSQPPSQAQQQQQTHNKQNIRLESDVLAGTNIPQREPSELLTSLRLPYDQMPNHVRAAIRSILFIADTIKNEDDENSAIEDWESMSMVVDRLFLWIFFLLCTIGSAIILAMAPSLYDQRDSIDDKLRIELPASNCSAFQT